MLVENRTLRINLKKYTCEEYEACRMKNKTLFTTDARQTDKDFEPNWNCMISQAV